MNFETWISIVITAIILSLAHALKFKKYEETLKGKAPREEGGKHTPLRKMERSLYAVAGELAHVVWTDEAFLKALAEKVGRCKMRVACSKLDYYTLIDPSTGHATKLLEYFVKGEIELYRIPETTKHFRMIDERIVVCHSRNQEIDFIWENSRPIIYKFRRKFKKLIKDRTPLKGESIYTEFKDRLIKFRYDENGKEIREPVTQEEKELLKQEINKILQV